MIADACDAMIDFISARPFFVASFCEHGDVLSQWRAYSAGGKGLALGFDSRELMMAAPKAVSFTVKCEYNEDRQRLALTELIDNLERAVMSTTRLVLAID